MGLGCPAEGGIVSTEVLERGNCALASSGCVIIEVVVCDFGVKVYFVSLFESEASSSQSLYPVVLVRQGIRTSLGHELLPRECKCTCLPKELC